MANRLLSDGVVDEAATHDEGAGFEDILPTYAIVSYGADFDVMSLINRIDKGDIVVPEFQRGFVWTNRQAARFIESLLIGLPVPGIFLWRDVETEKLVVVDGQQRLRTLQFFYQGLIRGKEFKIPTKTSPYQRVHPSFSGKSYRTLDDEFRRRLDISIIHATIVMQERPPADDTSIYYLFERINTEGTPLQPQEVRSAVYRGRLALLLKELNANEVWRSVYGPLSPRMKDIELIVRFLALRDAEFPEPGAARGVRRDVGERSYARPMKEFLNRFYSRHRNIDDELAASHRVLFTSTMQTLRSAIGQELFRPARNLNAAVFDAVMVGMARRLLQGDVGNLQQVRQAYISLLENDEFRWAYSRATADAERVSKRLELATRAFAEVE